MRTLIVFLGFLGVTLATTGFDASQAVSTSQFQCLWNNNYRFFIARVYKSYGAVDNTGIQNIKNANAAGWVYTDGYIFPCHSSTCKSAKAQVRDAVNALRNAGAKFGQIWIDVEIYNWGSDKNYNRQFILDMVAEVKALGIVPGIYTNNNNWQNIVGLSWSGVSDCPLWWANYNNDPGFGRFVPFGGWSKPAIHQYKGDVAGPCSVGLDMNYY
uniref:Lysozyme n=1 Tax=Syphacia muris TaxID=451379 RepID=A0A0N5AJI7_9BILA